MILVNPSSCRKINRQIPGEILSPKSPVIFVRWKGRLAVTAKRTGRRYGSYGKIVNNRVRGIEMRIKSRLML